MTDQFQLTEDQLAIQEMARRFTADRITPFAAQWDEDHHYPREVWKAAGELGFGAIYCCAATATVASGTALRHARARPATPRSVMPPSARARMILRTMKMSFCSREVPA